MWAYEQLHILEQLVYKEYLNKMRFEVARMQFEAILLKAILPNENAILPNENAILPYMWGGWEIVVGVTICSTVGNTNIENRNT